MGRLPQLILGGVVVALATEGAIWWLWLLAKTPHPRPRATVLAAVYHWVLTSSCIGCLVCLIVTCKITGALASMAHLVLLIPLLTLYWWRRNG